MTAPTPTPPPGRLAGRRAADVLYDNTPAAPQGRTEPDIAAVAPPSAPTPVADPRPSHTPSHTPSSSGETAELMYGDPTTLVAGYEPALRTAADTFADRTGTPAPLRDVALLLHDAGLPPTFGAPLGAELLRYMATPATDQERAAWAVQSRQQMRERFGEADAAKRMTLANDFIASRPMLGKELSRSGYGSHPDFVLALVDRAYTLRARSK